MIKQRDYSIDILKFLASFAVVMIHVDSNFRIGEFAPNTNLWDVSLMINLLTKWSVPIFVIVSGYYLLNDTREMSYKEFIKRRFSKILIPFLAWSLLYNLYYQYMGGNVSIVWAIVGVCKNLLGYPASAHLWFLYPLLALYLMTPIYKKIIDAVDFKMILILIGFTVIIKTIIPFTDVVMDWQANYWRDVPISNSAFAVYFILGGYLGRVNFSKKSKIAIYVVSAIAVIGGIIATYKLPMLYNRGLEVTLDISAINNLLLCLSLFLLFKDMKFKRLSNSKIFVNIVKFLSIINLGVFLVHPIIIDIVKPHFYNLSQGLVATLMLEGVVVYVITAIVVYIIKNIPILKRIV